MTIALYGTVNSREKIKAIIRRVRRCRPRSREQLRNYVRVFLGMDVPGCAMCEGHNAPMDYLWHSYSADFAGLPGRRRGMNRRTVLCGPVAGAAKRNWPRR